MLMENLGLTRRTAHTHVLKRNVLAHLEINVTGSNDTQELASHAAALYTR
jgi:hypothetical protein